MLCIYHVPRPQGPTGPTGIVEPNPYNLFVQSTATSNGDESQARPFQTIDEALAVAESNGIINVLQGNLSNNTTNCFEYIWIKKKVEQDH